MIEPLDECARAPYRRDTSSTKSRLSGGHCARIGPRLLVLPHTCNQSTRSMSISAAGFDVAAERAKASAFLDDLENGKLE